MAVAISALRLGKVNLCLAICITLDMITIVIEVNGKTTAKSFLIPLRERLKFLPSLHSFLYIQILHKAFILSTNTTNIPKVIKMVIYIQPFLTTFIYNYLSKVVGIALELFKPVKTSAGQVVRRLAIQDQITYLYTNKSRFTL